MVLGVPILKDFTVHVNASVTAKALGKISFHIRAENWKHLKDTFAFLWFLVCSNPNSLAKK